MVATAPENRVPPILEVDELGKNHVSGNHRGNKSVCDTPEISVVPPILLLGNNPLCVPGRGVCVSILPLSRVCATAPEIVVELGKNPALGDPRGGGNVVADYPEITVVPTSLCWKILCC